MTGEQIAQFAHARHRVGGVTRIRIALGDDLEVVEGLLRRGEVAAARVEFPHPLQKYGVAAGVDQPPQIIEIRRVAVGRIGAQEAVDGRDRVVVGAHFVLGVSGFDQRLLGIGAIRILGDQTLEGQHSRVVVAVADRALALFVQLGCRHAFVRVFVFEHAFQAGAAGAAEGQNQDQQQGRTQEGGKRKATKRHAGCCGTGERAIIPAWASQPP